MCRKHLRRRTLRNRFAGTVLAPGGSPFSKAEIEILSRRIRRPGRSEKPVEMEEFQHGRNFGVAPPDELARPPLSRPNVLVFDVNETLLDIECLLPQGVLDMLARIHGVPPNEGDRDELRTRLTGLPAFFDRQFTVDSYGAFKPARTVYHAVLKEMNVCASDCCMVASHVWDTIGAQGASLKAAFIRRKGNALLPVAEIPQPDYTAEDVLALAKQLSKGSA